MSRGKRYNSEPKLNIKKVIAVLLAFVVIIVLIIAIKKLVNTDGTQNITSKTYFTMYVNNKWGVIDNQSNTVIEPTYDEMIIIPDNKKDIFICTENVNYEEDTYKTKVLNSKGKEILKQYNNVQAIENYDEYNNLWYEKGIFKYEQDGKYGLIDTNGKVILEPNFEDITSLKGIKEVIITKKDSKIGLVNNKGVQIIPNQYLEVKSLGNDTNLYIVKNDNNQYGIYGKTEEKYQDIKNLNNKLIYCVKENNKYQIINEDNEKVLNDLDFDDIKQIKEDIVVYSKNKKLGAISINEEIKINCEYDDLKYTTNEYFIAKKNNSYGIINSTGNEEQKIEYAYIEYYEKAQVYELEPKNNANGENIVLNHQLKEIAKGIINDVSAEKSYIKVWTENGYVFYNLEGDIQNQTEILGQNTLFLKKENGKYGYVDKNGNAVVECIYDEAREQNEYGFAAVKKDGKWGAIDKKGTIVAEIKDELDENLLIDYIGRYHLGKDINLLCYTD